jgi:hypothetical protein
MKQKREHKAWLEARKDRCASCGETQKHLLILVDPETGKAVGVNSKSWWMAREERERRSRSAIVICANCRMREDEARKADAA